MEGRQCVRGKQGKQPFALTLRSFLVPLFYLLPLRGTGAPPALPDLVAGLLEQGFVGGVLPLHQLLDQAEEALAFGLLGRLGGEQLRPG